MYNESSSHLVLSRINNNKASSGGSTRSSAPPLDSIVLLDYDDDSSYSTNTTEVSAVPTETTTHQSMIVAKTSSINHIHHPNKSNNNNNDHETWSWTMQPPHNNKAPVYIQNQDVVIQQQQQEQSLFRHNISSQTAASQSSRSSDGSNNCNNRSSMKMLGTNDDLQRQYRAERLKLNAEMALSVQALPDYDDDDDDDDGPSDSYSCSSNNNNNAFTASLEPLSSSLEEGLFALGQPPLLKRPEPDKDEDIHNGGGIPSRGLAVDPIAAAIPRFSQRSGRSASSQPQKPIRGPCQCCFEEISSANSSSCTPQTTTTTTTTLNAKESCASMRLSSSSSKSSTSHIFCKDCLRRYVQEWVFGGADYQLVTEHGNTLPCMATDCRGGLIQHDVIQGVCSAALWENYQEKVFRMITIATAPPVDTSSDYSLVGPSLHQQQQQVDIMLGSSASQSRSDPPEVTGGLGRDRSFDRFPNHGRNHLYKSSSDPLVNQHKKILVQRGRWPGEKSSQTSKKEVPRSPNSSGSAPVHKVAEAMTEAKIRKCPNCHVSFLKESGCNKMKCPSCRAYMCYICRFSVDRHGYDHFCQHSYDSCHQKCGKCPLWTRQDEKMDQQRVFQVASDEANRLWEEALLQSTPNATEAVTGTILPLLQSEESDKKKGAGKNKWLRRLTKRSS